MGGSPLIGRGRELQALERALEAALQGQGSSVLLVGEPGIGKSRLADELSTRARAAGAAVAWGRAWESGGAPPLWPWREALGALQLEASLRDDGGDRFLRFARVEQAVRARCAQGPVVLVLDDLHAADTSTLELLVYLARTSRQHRLLLLGTSRDVEARQRPEVEGLLARFAREGVRLWLGRFSREQVRALAEGVAASPLPEAVLTQVFDATEGNPFFVDETVRAYLAQGTAAVPRGLPEGVRAVLQGRLGLLSSAARTVLETAGVLGRELDPAVLAQLHADAARALVEAEGTGALVRREDGRLAFAHVLLAEAL
ncbi:MAG: AAA family ATPase, partial [Myxococcaceae bacterium]|nr:AAA family ATPase [Myxococcaceae bacterium]